MADLKKYIMFNAIKPKFNECRPPYALIKSVVKPTYKKIYLQFIKNQQTTSSTDNNNNTTKKGSSEQQHLYCFY